MDDEDSSKRSWGSEDSDEWEAEEPVERKPAKKKARKRVVAQKAAGSSSNGAGTH